MAAESYDVVIVGSGVSGLAAAHYINKAAADSGRPVSYTIFEKGPGVGGTWLWTTYPGCACDGAWPRPGGASLGAAAASFACPAPAWPAPR